MNRSTQIKGRIQKAIRREGITVDEYSPDDIYDLMQVAQDQIFSNIGIEHEYEVMTIEDVGTYPLRANISNLNNLNVGTNATNPDTTLEANTTTGWSVTGGVLASNINRRTNSPGNYALKYTFGSYLDSPVKLSSISAESNHYQYIELYVRGSKASSISFYMSESDVQRCEPIIFSVTEDWVKVYGYMYITGDADELQFFTTLDTAGDWIEIDDLSLYSSSPDLAAKKMVGAVITSITPDTWDYELEFVDHLLWNEITKSTYDTTQPIRATIFQNNLILFPLPDTSNEIIKLWVYLEGSQTILNADTPPELRDSWDIAIEDFVMWRITGKQSYFESFDYALNTVGQTEHSHGLPRDREVDW
jgi:hypothetical protein